MDYIHKLKRLLPRGLHPHLGAVRRRLRSLPARTRRQKEQLLENTGLQPQERELLRQVKSEISPGDGMYVGDGAHYFKVGLSAIRCIEEALDAAPLPFVKQVLDLPCGHGRVLRFLNRRFPEAKFTASDLDRKGVDFCARHFCAEPVYSDPNPDRFSLGRRFDLIWCGSLVTHLNDRGIRSLLAFFARHLKPDGLLIFTTHGERVIQLMQNQEFEYGIAAESVAPIIEAYRKEGFGFADYPGASAYGVSLTSPEWIRRAAAVSGLGEVYFRAHGWDDHQDVYGFTLVEAV
ncbi:MAG: class I SAM-dependent methyltransferase [Pyrinomonadaceae bacterium]|nr:class I SAM-dependent methyltransferase [Pyrinomonadaceae bacterium]